MSTSIFNLPPAFSEPARDYAPGSVEREALFAAINEIRQHGPYEVPIVINGEEVKSGDLGQQVYPSDHKTVLANYHKASPEIVKQAIDGALAAKEEWEAVPWSEKVAIWHKMAYLVSNKYRYKLMAATMLGQC